MTDEHAPEPGSPGPEPDIARLVVTVAASALSVVLALAAVLELSLGWVLVALIVPLTCWALMLREVHRVLRYRGVDPEADAERDAKVWSPRL